MPTSESQMEYTVLETRKIVDILQAQVQLLTTRVEGLERYLLALTSQQQHQQQVMYGAPQLTTPTNPIPSQLYYWPNPTVEDGQQQQQQTMQLHPGVSNASSKNSMGKKQLEEDLMRLGIQTSTAATASGGLGVHSNSVVIPQQQLAAAMAQQQREEAIVAMINGQSSPIMTPTTSVGQGFPTGTGAHTINVEGVVYNNPNSNGAYAPYSTGVMVGGAAATVGTLPTSVTLDPSRATNEMLERACQQHWLKELCLKGCKYVSNLTCLARLKNLWKLNLQGCVQYVDDNAIKIISTYNKRLSRLNLCGCERVTDATPLSHLTFLFDLNLSGCQIGNDSIEAIAAHCSQLSRLAINSCTLVTSISSVGQLRELKLLYCRYSGNIAPSSISDVLAAIGGSLLTLNVDGVRFASLDLSRLPAVTALKNLNMKDNTDLKSLNWLWTRPNAEQTFAALEMLDIEGCTALTTMGPTVARLPALRFLRLSRTAISQEELNLVVPSPTLSAIYVEGCPNIHSVGCLADVKSLNKLMVDAHMQSQAAASGLDAIFARGGVEVLFGPHSNINNNAGSHQAPSLPVSPTSGIAPVTP